MDLILTPRRVTTTALGITEAVLPIPTPTTTLTSKNTHAIEFRPEV